ncbi:MAG TPA: PadR family transcriptional regulator [Anaerolineaceae bacterium]
MKELTNAELAILSLLAEAPKHGYQMEQDIANRGMRAWTEIAFSSIYSALNRLEVAGWLESTVSGGEKNEKPSIGGRGPARRVYQLTGQGWEALRAAVYERLAHPRPHTGDFDLALACLPVIPEKNIREALEIHRANLEETIRTVRSKWQADRKAAEGTGQALPAHVDALFDHALSILQQDLKWVTNYLQELNQEGTDDEN